MFKFKYNKIINIGTFDIRTGSFGVIDETDAVQVTMTSLDELNKLIFSYDKPAARQRLRVMILNSIKFDDADEGKIIIENIMSQAFADLNTPGFAIIRDSALACASRHGYIDARGLSDAMQSTTFSLAAFFSKDKSKNIEGTHEKEPSRYTKSSVTQFFNGDAVTTKVTTTNVTVYNDPVTIKSDFTL